MILLLPLIVARDSFEAVVLAYQSELEASWRCVRGRACDNSDRSLGSFEEDESYITRKLGRYCISGRL